MGTTPAAWLDRQRLIRAQEVLGETDLPLETVAQETGFGTTAAMRHHSMRVLQTSPLNYRRTFAERKVGSHCVSLRIPWPRRIDPLYPRS